MRRYTLPLVQLLIFLTLFSCGRKAADKVSKLHASSVDLEALAAKIMERTKLQPGERVFMIGRPGEFDSLIVLLSQKIQGAGADYLGTINVDTTSWPPSWNTDFVKSTDGKTREELAKIFDSLDLGIMLPGATPADTPYAAWQDVLREGKGRALHFHWAGANDLSGIPLAIDSGISRIYQRAILETDYAQLASVQEAFATALQQADVKITTPGAELTFRVGNRPVTRQDGDVSKERSAKARNLIDREVELPAGAVRASPMEETVDGTIAFPNTKWGDEPVEGLVVTFRKGIITDIRADKGLELVNERLASGKDGFLFREFAVGFNPLLAASDDNPRMVHYGYGAGILRLSFGNNEELGGAVRGDWVRINLLPAATVRVGDVVWVKDGKLVR